MASVDLFGPLHTPFPPKKFCLPSGNTTPTLLLLLLNDFKKCKGLKSIDVWLVVCPLKHPTF